MSKSSCDKVKQLINEFKQYSNDIVDSAYHQLIDNYFHLTHEESRQVIHYTDSVDESLLVTAILNKNERLS